MAGLWYRERPAQKGRAWGGGERQELRAASDSASKGLSRKEWGGSGGLTRWGRGKHPAAVWWAVQGRQACRGNVVVRRKPVPPRAVSLMKANSIALRKTC